MRVLIIEDEKPALENLTDELHKIDSSIRVIASSDSIRQSVRWLQEHAGEADLIFMDIQLSDGLSFNIFNACNVTSPVIFVTAYDKYLSRAFDYNSIDYILKPIDPAKLTNAVKKYKSLQHHFAFNYNSFLSQFNNQEKAKSRIVVKRGLEFQTIKVEDIVYFYTEHKLIFLVDKESRKYLAEKSNLAELEEELDQKMFYRANRKYIINANYIKRFKPLEKSKISVELILPVNEEIIISQENASSFKKWISEM